MITYWASPGSSPARSIPTRIAIAPSSVASKCFSPPPSRPNGVRTAETMTERAPTPPNGSGRSALARVQPELLLAVVDRHDVKAAQHVRAEQPLYSGPGVPEREVRADDRRRRQLHLADAPACHLDERRRLHRVDACDLPGRPLPLHLQPLCDGGVHQRPRRSGVERERERSLAVDRHRDEG